MLNEIFRQVLGMETGKKKKSRGRSHNKPSQNYHYHYQINQYQLPTPKKTPQRKMLVKMDFWTDWSGKRHYYKRYY